MKRIEKKCIYLQGALLAPLAVGCCAWISHNGNTIRTSHIVAIREISDHRASFETLNSYYCVEFAPVPVDTANPVYSLVAA